MKTLVVYSSQSGNTRKLAEAVYAKLGQEKTLAAVQEAPNPNDYDLVVVGFWLQAGKPDPKSKAFLETIGNTKLFLFATHGAAVGSAHATAAMDHAKSLVPSAQIAGSFSCQGEVNPKVLEKVQAKNPQPPWLKDADAAVGHPDETDGEHFIAALRAAAPDALITN